MVTPEIEVEPIGLNREGVFPLGVEMRNIAPDPCNLGEFNDICGIDILFVLECEDVVSGDNEVSGVPNLHKPGLLLHAALFYQVMLDLRSNVLIFHIFVYYLVLTRPLYSHKV